MRYAWQHYGDTGFTLLTLLFGIIFTLIIYYGLRSKYATVITVTATILITFKILIALTNIVVIPLWITNWY